MTSLSFAFLDAHDETLLRSIIGLLNTNKKWSILDEFKNDKVKKTVFINFNDKRSRILFDVFKESCVYDFILIGDPLKLEQEVGGQKAQSIFQLYPNFLERPFNPVKISQALSKSCFNANKGVSGLTSLEPKCWSDIFSIHKDKNILMFYEKDVCLLLDSQKQIYYSPQNKQKINDWIENTSELLMQDISDDLVPNVLSEWNLKNSFIYETFFYILYSEQFANTKKLDFEYSLKGKTFRLKKFPNFFPQVEESRSRYDSFYKVCFYLSNKSASLEDLVENLNIEKANILPIVYALNKLNYLENFGEQANEGFAPKVSQVKFLLFKIKNVLGMAA